MASTDPGPPPPPAAQSASDASSQVSGQQPSPVTHASIGCTMHAALHVEAAPTSTFGAHASALAAHVVGQSPSQSGRSITEGRKSR
jgi:hypothetical protein